MQMDSRPAALVTDHTYDANSKSYFFIE